MLKRTAKKRQVNMKPAKKAILPRLYINKIDSLQLTRPSANFLREFSILPFLSLIIPLFFKLTNSENFKLFIECVKIIQPIKIKAIILSRLNSMAASSIITRLPKEERGKVVLLLGSMKELPSEIAEKIAIDLAAKAQYIPESDAA